MKPHLNIFVQDYLRVILGTLFAVALVAFVSVPYTLGKHPGGASSGASAVDRHPT